MMPPRPLRQQSKAPTKTILETITSAASSIPGLIHGGLSTLSGYSQAFEDEAAFPRPSEAQYQAHQAQILSKSQSQQQQQQQQHLQQQVSASYASPSYVHPPPSLTDGEALEFFRKRPHLLKNSRGTKSNFLSPEYSSGTEQN
jgi:hypothetical protein